MSGDRRQDTVTRAVVDLLAAGSQQQPMTDDDVSNLTESIIQNHKGDRDGQDRQGQGD